MKVKVVIPASGAGVRLGGDILKQFLHLGGEPILKRTLSIFNALEIVAEIAVAVPEGYLAEVEGYKIPKLRHIVAGKQSRAESVFAALKCLEGNSETIVLIHDGIRPFVTRETIEAVAEATQKHGASVACSPVTDTIKQVDAQGKIISTPDRSTLWQAQTPQGFMYDAIFRAYIAAEAEGVLHNATDDSALAERIGIHVKIVPSSPANIKITTQTDLEIARALISPTAQCEGAWGRSPYSLGGKTMKKATIYTDGACSGNPGAGGYGAVLIYGSHRREISGSEKATTNNRMEMMAVIKSLEMLKEPCEVALYSDSRYVVDAIEKGWALRWQKNNWMRNKKEPALNPDLWEAMLELLRKHKVIFHWVKGHVGNPENERCDELARDAIKAMGFPLC